jgi:uncharacterized membrane protein
MSTKIRARYLHATESLVNVIVGYAINLLLVYILLHALGYQIRLLENAGMGLVIACFAFARGYCIRRIFNKIVQRAYNK